jgi:hypothetical protein
MNHSLLALSVVTLLGGVLTSCCDNKPFEVVSAFEEKSIAMAPFGDSDIKGLFRSAGWRVNVKDANMAILKTRGGQLVQKNGTSRYTLDSIVTTETVFNPFTGLNDRIRHRYITIYDSRSGYEILSSRQMDTSCDLSKLSTTLQAYTLPTAR